MHPENQVGHGLPKFTEYQFLEGFLDAYSLPLHLYAMQLFINFFLQVAFSFASHGTRPRVTVMSYKL